ncbi:hypothetical protein [Floccifex sp.]|uniref:hypothetical protein n=1 Tax=Floccifex sp. TaxID=2815810 RepID=UPI003F066721
MISYTKILENRIKYKISDENDDIDQKILLETVSLFCDFCQSFTYFLVEKGYQGDVDDTLNKVSFIKDKFKKNELQVSRGIKDWFENKALPSRKTSFQICFVFELGIEGTNEFFKKIIHERSFDLHTIEEAIYYFCMKNELSYLDAQRIKEQIQIPKKGKFIPNRNVLYTKSIQNCIYQMQSEQELIDYILLHIHDFEYNNATVIQYIQELWYEISKPNGLAVQEGILIQNSFNKSQSKKDEFFEEDFVVAIEDASTWTIYCQILGLSNGMEKCYNLNHDRSLMPVFLENVLLPLNASTCFPSRMNIDKIIRGELANHELFRKMLIFLSFYVYWVKIYIKHKGMTQGYSKHDLHRGIDTINNRLLDAGYPELYAANPYDWIFLWAMNEGEDPLYVFRYYMSKVFEMKK